MDWMKTLAEERIQEAIRKGDFDNLPGAGKPLLLDDDAMVPEELRLSYRLLKNAGAIPEELQLRKEILTLEDLLKCCRDGSEKTELRRQISAKQLRYRLLMHDRGWHASATFAEYEKKMKAKLNHQDL